MAYAPLPQSPAQMLMLHGRRTSVVVEFHDDEAPLWRYWGPSLPDAAVPPSPLRAVRALPSFALEHDQPLTVAPTFGVGWFNQSALLAHRQGRQFAQAFNRCAWRWDPSVPGQQALVLTLQDTVAELRLDLHLALHPEHDVLTVRSTLVNEGAAPMDVQWLAAATLPLPGSCARVRSWAGQHMAEFLEQEEPLSRSLWRRESRRGRTSHDTFPAAVVMAPGATEHAGLVYGAHLAWSGNHQQTIEWLHDGQYQWQLGEWLAPGEGWLRPGQSLSTPEVVASCSTEGFNGLAAAFHAELRDRLPWHQGRMKPRPVHLNTWEGFYFDLQPEKVKDLATAAAAVGVERFVVDDGWFHGRHHDRAALGDWWPDAGKFPQGLGPLVAHVRSLGMEFGLWVEPEMVNPDSDLHRAHPDWALRLDGRPLLTARNQLVLDISRPEVSDYLFQKIDAQVREHRIDYLKWDLNRDLTTAGLGAPGLEGCPGYRAQVHAAYALMQRLLDAHPALEIESCSGGGGRIDFGVLRHTHRVWVSDCIDARSRVADIQRGFLQFFPPEIMGSHVGTAPAHTTGRTQNMAFRAAVALPGHFGIEFDLRTLDEAAQRELADWISLYKRWRHRLHRGRVWQGRLADGLLWQVHGQEDEDFIVLVYRVEPSTHRYPPALPLPMLRGDHTYAIRQIEPQGRVGVASHDTTAPWIESQRQAPVSAHGAWLAQAGLPLPRVKAEVAVIFHLQPCTP